MSTREGEPAVKKLRLSRSRTLKLDLDELPPWVETASDEKLVKVFKIGAMVNDSVSAQVNFEQEYIDGVIKTKLDSMVETVNNLAVQALGKIDVMQQRARKEFESFKDKTSANLTIIDYNVKEFKKGMEKQIDQVEKQQSSQTHSIQEAIKRTENALVNCKKGLEQISTLHNKAECEQDEMNQGLSLMTMVQTQVHESHKITEEGKYRYLVKSTRNDQAHYLMQVLLGNEGCMETEQFETDVKDGHFKVGILISMRSGIAKRAIGKRFEIMFMDGQHFIYLPNASKDQHLIVWAIYTADELVALNQDLGKKRQRQVAELYEDFKKNVATCQSCTDKLTVLKKTADELEKNLVPLSKIILQTKEKLKMVLGTNSTVERAGISQSSNYENSGDVICID